MSNRDEVLKVYLLLEFFRLLGASHDCLSEEDKRRKAALIRVMNAQGLGVATLEVEGEEFHTL
jgi:hypothetical protein